MSTETAQSISEQTVGAEPATARPQSGDAALLHGTAPGGMRSDWAIMKRLFRDYLWQHRVRIALSLIAMAVVSAMTVASMWLLQPAVDDVLLSKQSDTLWRIAGAIVIVFLVKALAMAAQGMLTSYFTMRAIADLQIDLFQKIIRADLALHNTTHSGRFAAHFLNDTQQVRRTISGTLTNVTKESAIAIGLMAYVYYQDVTLAVMASIVLPLIALLVRKLGRRTQKAAKKGMVETGTMSSLMMDSLDGVRIVKAYGQEEREITRMTDSVNRRFRHQLKAMYSQVLTSPSTEALTGMALAGILLYGGLQTIAGNLTPGELVSVLFAIGSAYRPLRTVARQYTDIAEGLAAAERVFQAIDVEPEVTDAPDARPLAVDKGAVRFNAVSFGYLPGKPALTDVTIDVPAGAKVALVGPSGAGKSTVLNLIPRFYDVTTGQISIDGQDIRAVRLADLRRSLSFVTQDPYLFDDTIAANIAYGRPDASRADIERAAKAAAAHGFVMDLDGTYDAVVGEHGVTLSGGQKQRIAIARAILTDAPILLLDEATSALDTESERLIQEALGRLMVGRTTIAIAHRLSTIIDADIIYVMDRGRVIERGHHRELLALDGVYAQLYRTQFEAALEPGGARETTPRGGAPASTT